MALPVLHKRGDIVMMVAFNNPMTYVNFCGATSISLNLENAVSEVRVGDCEDWSLPTRVIASYGAQTVNATVNAQLARSNRDRLLRWAKDQIALPVRLHIVSAPSGEVEYIDGMGMLATLNVENIGSTDDGAVVTTTLNIRFEDGVEFINSGQVLTAPQFTSMPSLLGSTALGGTITINLGVASGVPAPVMSGTLSRPGASPVAVTQGQQITIASGDQGGSLSLTAVATNSQGTDTEIIARSVPAAEPTTAPAITNSPVITGSTTAGGTLSSTLGTASGNPAPNATRQWLADGVAIAGATGATLDTTGRAGQSISLRVTWSNGTGSPAVAMSNAIAIVAAATAPVPFAAGDWSLATGLEANQLVVNINALPTNGGSPITAIQYSANNGTWTALPGGAGTGPRTLTMPAAGTSYGIRLRAVNAVGNSTPGDTKTATSGAAGAIVGGAAIGSAGATGTIYEGFRLADGDDFTAAPTRWTGRNLDGRYGHSAMHIGFRRTSGSDIAMYIDPAFRGARSQSPVDLGYDGASINGSVLSLTASEPPAELLPLLPTVFTGGSGDALDRPKLITGGLKTGPSFMFSAQGGFVIEGKVRLQSGIIHGYWPSFWTSTFFWPGQGEIDIVEVSKDPVTGVNSSQMNLHRSAEGGGTIRVATPTYPFDRWVTTAVRRMQGSTLIEFFDDAANEGVMVLRDTMETPLGSIDGAHDIRLDMAVSNSWDTTTFNPDHWPAKVDFDWWRAWVPTTAAYANEPTLILPAVRTTPGGSWAATFPAASELYSPGAGQEQVTAAFDNHDAPGMPTRSGTTKLPTSMSVNMTARTVSGTVPTTEGGCTGVFLTRSYDDGSPVQRVLLPFHVAPAIQSLASGWSFDQGAAVDITIPYTAFHSGNLGPHTYQVTAPGLTVTGNGTTEVRITGTASATTSITVDATNIEGQTTSAMRSMTVVAAGAAWVNVVPQDSGPTEARGVVTANGDGSYRVTTQGTSAGRAHFTQPAAGSVVELEVSMQFNDATRLILRQVGLFSSNTGVTVLDVSRTSVGQVLTQTITYTVDASRPLMHLIGVTTAGQYFTVNAAMRYRVIS